MRLKKNHKNPKRKTMDKVKIKRVKRVKKQASAKEKIVAGLGLGATLLGGAGAITSKPSSTQFVRSTNTEGASASSKIKNSLKKIFSANNSFGISQARADVNFSYPAALNGASDEVKTAWYNLMTGNGTAADSQVYYAWYNTLPNVSAIPAGTSVQQVLNGTAKQTNPNVYPIILLMNVLNDHYVNGAPLPANFGLTEAQAHALWFDSASMSLDDFNKLAASLPQGGAIYGLNSSVFANAFGTFHEVWNYYQFLNHVAASNSNSGSTTNSNVISSLYPDYTKPVFTADSNLQATAGQKNSIVLGMGGGGAGVATSWHVVGGGALPAGFTFVGGDSYTSDNLAGMIEGIPTQPGTYDFSVWAATDVANVGIAATPGNPSGGGVPPSLQNSYPISITKSFHLVVSSNYNINAFSFSSASAAVPGTTAQFTGKGFNTQSKQINILLPGGISVPAQNVSVTDTSISFTFPNFPNIRHTLGQTVNFEQVDSNGQSHRLTYGSVNMEFFASAKLDISMLPELKQLAGGAALGNLSDQQIASLMMKALGANPSFSQSFLNSDGKTQYTDSLQRIAENDPQATNMPLATLLGSPFYNALKADTSGSVGPVVTNPPITTGGGVTTVTGSAISSLAINYNGGTFATLDDLNLNSNNHNLYTITVLGNNFSGASVSAVFSKTGSPDITVSPLNMTKTGSSITFSPPASGNWQVGNYILKVTVNSGSNTSSATANFIVNVPQSASTYNYNNYNTNNQSGQPSGLEGSGRSGIYAVNSGNVGVFTSTVPNGSTPVGSGNSQGTTGTIGNSLTNNNTPGSNDNEVEVLDESSIVVGSGVINSGSGVVNSGNLSSANSNDNEVEVLSEDGTTTQTGTQSNNNNNGNTIVLDSVTNVADDEASGPVVQSDLSQSSNSTVVDSVTNVGDDVTDSTGNQTTTTNTDTTDVPVEVTNENLSTDGGTINLGNNTAGNTGQQTSDNSALINSLKQQVADLQNQITALKKQLADQNSGNSSNAGYLQQILSLQQQVNSLTATIAQLQRSNNAQTFDRSSTLLQYPGTTNDQNQTTNVGTYTVKKGDTLWGISKRFYGSGTMWRKILEANTDKVKNPRTMRIGITLNIPALSQADAAKASTAAKTSARTVVTAKKVTTNTAAATFARPAATNSQASAPININYQNQAQTQTPIVKDSVTNVTSSDAGDSDQPVEVTE